MKRSDHSQQVGGTWKPGERCLFAVYGWHLRRRTRNRWAAPGNGPVGGTSQWPLEQQVRPVAMCGWHLKAGWREINDCPVCEKDRSGIRLYARGSISRDGSPGERYLFAVHGWVAPKTRGSDKIGTKALIVPDVLKTAQKSNCAQKAASRQMAPRLSGVLSQSRGAR